MKIECPTCRNINRLSGNLMVTRSEGLEINCPKCKALIKLYVLAKSDKDSTQQTAYDPFGDQIEPVPIDLNRQSGDPGLKSKILRSLVNLPPMPHIILKAKEIMEDPRSSLRDLAGVIETDQAIVARVLTLANSAYYGVSGMVSSIQHASVLLGQKTLAELITISASSRLLSKRLKGYKVEPESLWKHSLAVAFGSKIIVQQLAPELADDAFVAGLLHDAGKIILDPYVHERHEDFDKFLKDDNKSFLKAEQEILGFDHAEIMSRATRFWRFSETQSIAIRFHHYPSVSENNQLAHIVHLANYLANTSDMGVGGDASEPALEPGVLKFLGISADSLDVVLDEVVDSIARLEKEYQEKSP